MAAEYSDDEYATLQVLYKLAADGTITAAQAHREIGVLHDTKVVGGSYTDMPQAPAPAPPAQRVLPRRAAAAPAQRDVLALLEPTEAERRAAFAAKLRGGG